LVKVEEKGEAEGELGVGEVGEKEKGLFSKG
jgi:hypothetical protein